MKRSLLSWGICFLFLNSYSQITPLANGKLSAYSVVAHASNPKRSNDQKKPANEAPIVMAAPLGGVDEVIGGTLYDLQTMRSIPNNIYVHADGTISTVWNFSNVTGFNDRGTGYNYFDGTTWGALPTQRIESVRTGFPSLACSRSGKECVVSHSDIGLVLSTRLIKGQGNWQQSSFVANNFYPCVKSGGSNDNTLHMLAVKPTLFDSAGKPMNFNLVYARSTDWGLSWDKVNATLPGLDSTIYHGFDPNTYALDTKGDTIVIVAGGYDVDVVLLRSFNNGDTWSKTVLQSFPILNYDPRKMISDINNDQIADTLESNDGSVACALDVKGKVHVAFGRMRVICTDTTEGIRYFPATDGLYYWNDTMQKPMLAIGVIDRDGNGKIDLPTDSTHLTFGDYQVSMTSHPQFVFDINNELHIGYSSNIEYTDDGTARAYRHSLIRYYNKEEGRFCYPLDLVNDDFAEGVFGSMYKYITLDDHAHIVYQRDFYAGYDVPKEPISVSDIVSLDLDLSDWGGAYLYCYTGVSEENMQNIKLNFIPNPATSSTYIKLDSKNHSIALLQVYNVMGDLVLSQTQVPINIGINEYKFDVSNFKPGVYLVNMLMDGQIASGRLVVQ